MVTSTIYLRTPLSPESLSILENSKASLCAIRQLFSISHFVFKSSLLKQLQCLINDLSVTCQDARKINSFINISILLSFSKSFTILSLEFAKKHNNSFDKCSSYLVAQSDVYLNWYNYVLERNSKMND